MELSEYVQTLRKRWLVIVTMAILGGGAAFLVSSTTTPTYRATTKVFVSLSAGESVTDLVQGSNYTQDVVRSYAQLISMPAVLGPVIERLDLDLTPRELARSVSADAPLDTVILEISVTSTSPTDAALIANAIAEQLAETVDDVSPNAAGAQETVVVNIVSPAEPPAFASSPNTRLMTATGLVGGGGLGAALAIGITLLDTRVRSSRDIARISDEPVLGAVPRVRSAEMSRPALLSDPHSARSEAYRRLQTNLRYLDASGPISSIVVTSAVPREGKSSTALNLALAIAEKGQRVLLIDADLRRPSIADYAGIEGGVGLTTVLIGQAELADVVQPWGTPDLHILSAGAVPPNPSQLLDSQAMVDLLKAATASYDLVILDSPPLLPVADAAVLTRLTDGGVMVTGCRKVTRDQVAEALASLDAVGARLLGIVVNGESKAAGEPVYTYEPVSHRRHGGTGPRPWYRRRPASTTPSTPTTTPDAGRSTEHDDDRRAEPLAWRPTDEDSDAIHAQPGPEEAGPTAMSERDVGDGELDPELDSDDELGLDRELGFDEDSDSDSDSDVPSDEESDQPKVDAVRGSGPGGGIGGAVD